MASISVMYTLCAFVMASGGKDGASNVFKLVPRRDINKYPSLPRRNSTKHVKEGRNITFVCSVDWVTDPIVYWYRVNSTGYVAFVQYYNGVCRGNVTETSLVKLHVGNTSCGDESYELRIRDIDQQYGGGWYCVVNQKWQSRYVDLEVDIHDEISTSRKPRAPTTSILQTTVSRHEASSTKPTEAATEYTTERTDNESPSRNTLVPLIGGAAGGGIVLLILVITGCALYRSKRGSNHPDDGQASTYPNRQPGNAEAVVMEENPLYSSSGPGNDDYAQIDCRESASPSHEKGETSMVKTQPNPDDCQAGPDIGDIYAVPDKSKKSAAEDVEDVYSQVQKPKK
ncbi:uncharacterized protein LOC124286113 isoform X2 [Haliotis rubra]|uniref:uncharacterized protein LOC124286113 isoform X2 n=1 Tax=Haliotis rubra TaxID=36100 RepID=UPI001EE61B53|nr:uncharacterized protein LOC124286113 isoform X2 [Haliotis rubra]